MGGGSGFCLPQFTKGAARLLPPGIPAGEAVETLTPALGKMSAGTKRCLVKYGHTWNSCVPQCCSSGWVLAQLPFISGTWLGCSDGTRSMLSTVTSRTEPWWCSTEQASESSSISISQQLLYYPVKTNEGGYESCFVMGISTLTHRAPTPAVVF